MTYPRKITLTSNASQYINQLTEDLALGHVELHQFPASLFQLYEFGFENGRASLAATLERLERECERLYFELSIRQPTPRGEYTSWADLQKRRAEREEAAAGNYAGGDLKAAWGISA